MARIHILGSGTPTPTPTRFGSSFVVTFGQEKVMIDCGPAATHKLVKVGLWPTDINHLFFTHHHFDHNVDYPCFLLCRWDQSTGQERKLQVYGPPLTEKITHGLLNEKDGVFAHDWIARINHPLSQRIHVNRGGTLPRKPPDVMAKDIGPGLIHSEADWQMIAATAEHVQPYLDSLAYRLETPDGSIVFTGDTQPCDSVVNLSKKADAMLCMCWDDQEIMEKDGEAPYQCGTIGAAIMAQQARVKRLILVHIGPHLADSGPRNKAVKDVRNIFDGEVIFSNELTSFDI